MEAGCEIKIWVGGVLNKQRDTHIQADIIPSQVGHLHLIYSLEVIWSLFKTKKKVFATADTYYSFFSSETLKLEQLPCRQPVMCLTFPGLHDDKVFINTGLRPVIISACTATLRLTPLPLYYRPANYVTLAASKRADASRLLTASHMQGLEITFLEVWEQHLTFLKDVNLKENENAIKSSCEAWNLHL